MKRAALITALILPLLQTTVPLLRAQQRITLEEAHAMAQSRYPGLEMARQRVEAAARRGAGVASNYFPEVRTQVNYGASSAGREFVIPAGSLGEVPDLGPFPTSDIGFDQLGRDILVVQTTLTQPLTHIFRIRQQHGVARAEEDVARAELERAHGDLVVGVTRAYAALLVAERQREVAELLHLAATERAGYRQAALEAGTALSVAAAEARIVELEARQAVLTAEHEVENASSHLAELLDLPPGTVVQAVAPAPVEPDTRPLAELLALARREHPDLIVARARLAQAEHGLSAARAEFVPDVGLIGMHVHQSAIPFLPRNSFAVGVRMDWAIWDSGQRAHASGERRAQRTVARHNLELVERQVEAEVERTFRRLSRSWQLVELARQALAVRTEATRLRNLQFTAGYALDADEREAEADLARGELEALQAEMGYRIAMAELSRAVGSMEP